jgi:hypothetical protein
MIEDPFGTNSVIGNTVRQGWNEVFLELKETYKDERNRAAIIGVVSALLWYYLLLLTYELLHSPRWSSLLGKAQSANPPS